MSKLVFNFILQIGGSSGAYVLYDTFSFKLILPPISRKLEFCVCFRCDGTEYWDSNEVSIKLLKLFLLYKLKSLNSTYFLYHHQGKNYIINKRYSGPGSPTDLNQTKRHDHGKKECSPIPTTPMPIPSKYANATQAKIAAWSEFSSWNQFEHEGPYW